jgi:hypothetical protein
MEKWAMSNRTREERESILRFDETDEPAFLWTASPREARRWTRRGLSVVEEPGGWSARCDKRQITVRKARTVLLSNEKRIEAGRRLAEGRVAKRSPAA